MSDSRVSTPSLKFVLIKTEDKGIQSILLPGDNCKKSDFNFAKNYLMGAFKLVYHNSYDQYIRTVKLGENKVSEENKEVLETISINQDKLIAAMKVLLEHKTFTNNYKIEVEGKNKDGNDESVVIKNSVEALNARKVIPYYNKHNNDLTSNKR